jgi:hypothetical protein
MSRRLSESPQTLELNGAKIPDRRMTPGGIVKQLDIVEHSLGPGCDRFAFRAFGL